MDKKEIIEKIRLVLERHSYVVKAELFGSFVRGNVRPDSDVDLLVVFDNNRPKGFKAYSIYGDLEASLGRKVDIVEEHLLHECVKNTIQNTREMIYERR